MEKQGPGEYKRSHGVTVAPSLADLGLTKMQSSRWQLLARIPDDGDVTEQQVVEPHRCVGWDSLGVLVEWPPPGSG